MDRGHYQPCEVIAGGAGVVPQVVLVQLGYNMLRTGDQGAALELPGEGSRGQGVRSTAQGESLFLYGRIGMLLHGGSVWAVWGAATRVHKNRRSRQERMVMIQNKSEPRAADLGIQFRYNDENNHNLSYSTYNKL